VSSFGGLNIALSALLTQQRALEITGHNVSNAQTEGYSRQRVEQAALSGPSVPALHMKYTGAGTGVKVSDILRARNAFLEARSYAEDGAYGQLNTIRTALSRIELVFGEPSDRGIQNQLSEFWSAWDDVANSPADAAARSQLVQRAVTLSDTLKKASGDIANLREDAIAEVRTKIDEVNGAVANIAKLNEAIQNATVAGLEHNDLIDQRDLLVSKLSGLVNVTARAGENGMLDVYTDGGPLVRGVRGETLTLDASEPRIAIRWSKDGYPSNQSAGVIGGLMTTINDTYPRYLNGLDNVANAIRDRVNEIHGLTSPGTMPLAVQDLSGVGALSFTYSVNGAAPTTVNLAGADWSGVGGAVALQTALTNAINNPAITVSVTGGNGEPMRIKVSGTDPTASVTLGADGANPAYGLMFGNRSLTSTISAVDQDQSAAASLEFRVRLNSGAWSTVSVTPDDWSGAGGAAALQTALNAALPAGVTAVVSGGNGSPMHIAYQADNPADTLEVGEIGTHPNQDPGYALFLSGVPLGEDRIGGRAFFTGSGATDLTVTAEIAADPSRIAATAPGRGPTDGGAALLLAQLGEDPRGPDSVYRSYIVELGAETQTINRRVEIQGASLAAVNQAREAEAGVNLDEEMVNMVVHQQAYHAAARFMTTIDEALEQLILRTGLVGR